MAQEYLTINSKKIKQPDKGLGYDFETTYSEDSTRVQSGVAHLTPLFTVEAFSYTATNLTLSEMSEILKIVAKGGNFTLHYLSPYYAKWRDDTFYVGKGSLRVGRWLADKEVYEELSFSMIGVNPL